MDYQDLGRRVRTIRRQMGLTQEELAEQLGISTSFLGHIERGTRAVSVETLVQLCNVLNISPVYLLSASLQNSGDAYRIPDGLSTDERSALSRFLHLAEEAVSGWEKK